MIGGFCEGKRRKGSGFSGLLVPSLPLIASRRTFRDSPQAGSPDVRLLVNLLCTVCKRSN
jgi:hypothetical protein